MKNASLGLLLSIYLIAPLAWGELSWRLDKDQNQPDSVRIEIASGSEKDFAEVLGALKQSQTLTSIALGRLAKLEDERLQSQIFGYLAANHRQPLSLVLGSKGQQHSQALQALRPAFHEALLSTSFVRSLDWQLQTVGWRIAGVDSEKFYIFNNNDFPNFDAITWLIIEPAPAAAE